eukprot:scaffold284322_cov41-Tisochrysis_lutea.AAC.1
MESAPPRPPFALALTKVKATRAEAACVFHWCHSCAALGYLAQNLRGRNLKSGCFFSRHPTFTSR